MVSTRRSLLDADIDHRDSSTANSTGMHRRRASTTQRSELGPRVAKEDVVHLPTDTGRRQRRARRIATTVGNGRQCNCKSIFRVGPTRRGTTKQRRRKGVLGDSGSPIHGKHLAKSTLADGRTHSQGRRSKEVVRAPGHVVELRMCRNAERNRLDARLELGRNLQERRPSRFDGDEASLESPDLPGLHRRGRPNVGHEEERHTGGDEDTSRQSPQHAIEGPIAPQSSDRKPRHLSKLGRT
mmetsp:Transcript_95338/g.256297  ORF Transcript_95338/g.256297 Transcript_95338/m.256297 type:complete len:240 (-) Transcript_95338:12-731(-)